MYLEKNLTFIKEMNPDLAKKLESVDVDENIVEVISTNIQGALTCRASSTSGGYKKLIHSMIDPLEEAHELCADIGDFEKSVLTVIIGFGFGYHIKEILKKRSKVGRILIIEPRLDILKIALINIDLSDILATKNLYIMEKDEHFRDKLYTFLLGNIVYIKDPMYFQLNSYDQIIIEELKDIRKVVSEMIIYTKIAIGDSPGDTLVGILNTFNNLEYLIKSFDILSIKNKYAGVPAIIVSAGPSLDKNFRLLKDLKGKALIIAAETINEKLLTNGIVPDVVSVLERGMNVFDSYFKDKELNTESVLFGQSLIESNIFAVYPGKYVTCIKDSTVFEKWISKLLEGLNAFSSGQSVANMNFSIARLLGCNPIVLIGQDLSYAEDGRTHARETITENETIEDHLREDDYINPEDIIDIKGNYCDFVKSNTYWKQFLHWFEMEVVKTEGEVINATEGGAYIHGTKLMRLQDVIEKCCCGNEGHVKFIDDIKEVDEAQKRHRISTLIQGLETEIYNQRKLKKAIEWAIDTCDDILSTRPLNEKKVNSVLEKIRDLKLRFQEYSDLFAYVVQAPRVVSLQNDINVTDILGYEQLDDFVIAQKNFFADMNGIIDLTLKIFMYGFRRANAVKENKHLDEKDIEEILNGEGDEIL